VVSQDGLAVTRTRRADLIVVAAGIVGLVLVWFSGSGARPLGFPLDDAWIHMVYGKNVAEHASLAFNDVASTGSTAPLWALLVGLAHLAGGGDVDRVVVLVYLIGAVLHLVTLVLMVRLVRALVDHERAAIAAGLLGAVSGPLAMAALSGMEVSLTTALVLAALLACVRRAWLYAGIWLALGAVARPEVALVSVACFAFAIVHTRDPRALAKLVVPSIVVGAAYIAFALHATGRPLPATFYMKQQASLGDLPGRISVGLRGLVGDVPPFETGLAAVALIGVVFPGLVRPQKPRAPLVLVAGAGALLLLASLMLVRPLPDVFYHLRYLLPAVPLLVIALVVGAHELGRLELLRRAPWAPLAFVFSIGLLEGVITLPGDSTRMHNDTRNIDEVQRVAGTWLRDHTAPASWIATGDAGAVRYFSERNAVDVMGLNTPELYWSPGWAQAHPVAAIVVIPCWFRPTDPRALRMATRVATEHYTVTESKCMAEQVVVTCTQDVPAMFTGIRTFTVRCTPGGLR
jgi:hypothetical protein